MYKCHFIKTLFSDKGVSSTSLPTAAHAAEQKASSTQEIKASSEDFQLSLPQYETPEHELHQKSAPGSTSSLDELCGRKKNKSDKEERFSKFSKKLFGKKDREESEQDGETSKSTENIPNGKETTAVKENDVDIEICPIDHAPDNQEPDIDIYPLDEAEAVPAKTDVSENHFPNGLNEQDASLGLGSKDSSKQSDGNKGLQQGSVTTNHVDKEMTAISSDKHSTSDELYQQVLSGNVDVTIPNMAKMVRIFTSSTFTGNKKYKIYVVFFQQISIPHMAGFLV